MNNSNNHLIKFRGLTDEEVLDNRAKYGKNVLTPPKKESAWKLFFGKFDDPVIRILLIAAFISIVISIIDVISGHSFNVEGVGIIIAILLATGLAFLNEYKAEQEFDILNKVNDEILIKTIRNGQITTIIKKDIVVGDIIIIENGDEIPADGDILEAVSLQINESRLTGESNPAIKSVEINEEKSKDTTYHINQVLKSTMVVDGHGIMKVTSVGDSTEIGKTARASREETDKKTPLNIQLEKLSKLIGIVGLSFAIITFIALTFRSIIFKEIIPETGMEISQWSFLGIFILSVFLALIKIWLPIFYDAFELLGKEIKKPKWLEKEGILGWLKILLISIGIIGIFFCIGYFTGFIPKDSYLWFPKGSNMILTFFMIAVTIIVVAVPEGLAMSVTLSLAYSMRKMTATKNLVRRMHACETIGAATVICSDKTGTLTKNEMNVFEINFPLIQNKEIPQNIIDAFSLNTTANLGNTANGDVYPIGNPTECSLLLWLNDKNIDYIIKRSEFNIISQLTFSTERKYMATIGYHNTNNRNIILHFKGAPEIVLDKCSFMQLENEIKPITQKDKKEIHSKLKIHQEAGRRTLGFAYQENLKIENTKEIDFDNLSKNLIWLGFCAISDPVREEVPSAVQACKEAGIQVKIVTGDNQETALEIAKQIKLIEDKDNLKHHITGKEFSELKDSEVKQVVKNLRVLSRAKPMDKLKLVKSLRECGEVVAVTGDGTNDAPALNYADVGLAMGKTGTEVAKEASDIILLDDSFNSIVNGIMWGRSLYQNIQRFILFQLTINIVALGIALLGPFIGVELPLTVTQMLWVNLIMDTFAALALATEPPHWDVMKNPPRKQTDFIISKDMAKNILFTGAAFLVLLVAMLVFFKNFNINIANFSIYVSNEPISNKELSLFFTIFIMLQLWNLFNARCLGLSQSAFKGITKNKGFIIIFLAIFLGQIAIMQFGGSFFRTEPLNIIEWIIIIGITSLVLWIGEIKRFFKSQYKKQNRIKVNLEGENYESRITSNN